MAVLAGTGRRAVALKDAVAAVTADAAVFGHLWAADNSGTTPLITGPAGKYHDCHGFRSGARRRVAIDAALHVGFDEYGLPVLTHGYPAVVRAG